MALGSPPQGDVTPLHKAHAHNDYRHDPPLLKALGQGFTSVEADIFLVGDKLCVAHESREIVPDKTLQSLYLQPLRERVQRNAGRVFRKGPRFTLLVDIKSAAEPTYQRLHEILHEYREMLTTFGPDGRKDGAVLVVVSGNRPLEKMRAQRGPLRRVRWSPGRPGFQRPGRCHPDDQRSLGAELHLAGRWADAA